MDRFKMFYRCLKQNIFHFRKMYFCMNAKMHADEHNLAIMIKHIHSIEKGLATDVIRPGFGMGRANQLLDCVDIYVSKSKDMHITELSMAYGALQSYIDYHEKINYSTVEYEQLKHRYKQVFQSIESGLNKDYGGVIRIDTKEEKVDLEAVSKCIMTRHSIRDFKDEPVDEKLLEKAICLAMYAPSACNRQSTRVYILDHTKFDTIEGWTGGVKTFLHKVDKILIITGKMSAYEKDEYWQYAVSSSIFAGYLSLTLHAVGLGGCLLQRSLVNEQHWEKVAKTHKIPEDEQVVCAMAVGVPKDKIKVPVSRRMEFERIVKKL